jgi:hypothetical protein
MAASINLTQRDGAICTEQAIDMTLPKKEKPAFPKEDRLSTTLHA